MEDLQLDHAEYEFLRIHELYRSLDRAECNMEAERIRLIRAYEQMTNVEMLDFFKPIVFNYAYETGAMMKGDEESDTNFHKVLESECYDTGRLGEKGLKNLKFLSQESIYPDFRKVQWIGSEVTDDQMRQIVNKIKATDMVYDQLRVFGFDMECVDGKPTTISITSKDKTYTFYGRHIEFGSEGVKKLKELFGNSANLFFGWGIANDVSYFNKLEIPTSNLADLQKECRRKQIDVKRLDEQFCMMFELEVMKLENHRPRNFNQAAKLCTLDSWKTYLIGLSLPKISFAAEMSNELIQEYENEKGECVIYSNMIENPPEHTAERRLEKMYKRETDLKEEMLVSKYKAAMENPKKYKDARTFVNYISSTDIARRLRDANICYDEEYIISNPERDAIFLPGTTFSQLFNTLKQIGIVKDAECHMYERKDPTGKIVNPSFSYSCECLGVGMEGRKFFRKYDAKCDLATRCMMMAIMRKKDMQYMVLLPSCQRKS